MSTLQNLGTVGLLLAAALALALAPTAADSTGASAGCTQHWTRDYADGEQVASKYERTCAVSVNEGGWVLCLGSTEAWYVTDEEFGHGYECEQGISW